MGFVCGVVMIFVRHDTFGVWWGTAVEEGIHTLGWFVVFGLLCAVIALVRVEKWWGVATAGLVLNGGVIVIYFLNGYSVWPGLWPEP